MMYVNMTHKKVQVVKVGRMIESMWYLVLPIYIPKSVYMDRCHFMADLIPVKRKSVLLAFAALAKGK